MEDHHALLQTELDALSIVVRGFTIIDAPPFFESAGREEREPREEVDGEGEGCIVQGTRVP